MQLEAAYYFASISRLVLHVTSEKGEWYFYVVRNDGKTRRSQLNLFDKIWFHTAIKNAYKHERKERKKLLTDTQKGSDHT